VSGFDQVVAQVGALERLLAGAPTPVAGVPTSGSTSFAAELERAAADALPVARASARGSTAELSRAALASGAGASTSRLFSGSAISLPSVSGRSAGGAATAAAYRPTHVTETDDRVWNDCTWASASMLIDKLTGGAVKVDREALRAASGDRTGGSSLADVVRGARNLLGFDLGAAESEHLTFDGLLDRLASGGGAIVQGSYANLPSSLTRYDPAFAAKGAAASGHAVYVGPLDRATGKVWWDDPLAPADGSGQWISVDSLRKFAWTDSQGRVSAMATPADSTASSR
jgi:hypothetical protein